MKEKEKRKRKKKEKGEKIRKEREEESDREREKGEKRKRGIFSVFRRLNPEGPRVKVDPRIAGYTWVPISWSFFKLCEVENFPTWNIFSLKAM